MPTRIALSLLAVLSLQSVAGAQDAANTLHGLPLVFSEDFENGCDRWETTDDSNWELKKVDGNTVFGLNARRSDYKPKVRSPLNIALIKDLQLADVAVTFRVRSTKDTGNHRDCCVFFNHQDASNFYYVHTGARPDPHSSQIFVVKDAPRRALTENKTRIPWTDDWHNVKLVRDSQTGTIELYFDNMDKPHMATKDTTFGKGRLGIGSFDDMNDYDNIRVYGR